VDVLLNTDVLKWKRSGVVKLLFDVTMHFGAALKTPAFIVTVQSPTADPLTEEIQSPCCVYVHDPAAPFGVSVIASGRLTPELEFTTPPTRSGAGNPWFMATMLHSAMAVVFDPPPIVTVFAVADVCNFKVTGAVGLATY